ncbi:glutamate decarboxylase 4-like isoform X2 [Corylus avellana]|uniref:glutamate decarboxylase 4-like isoform X2 n=1 Tax=Corylus avellana TaxID=13451 RepID=UPI00286BF8F6|nr:glutamate decarboxylase 4-like isoform X2 [Corylus avellana]
MLSKPASESDLSVLATSASRFVLDAAIFFIFNEFLLTESMISLSDLVELQAKVEPGFVRHQFVMEPESDELIMESFNKNFVDSTLLPQNFMWSPR